MFRRFVVAYLCPAVCLSLSSAFLVAIIPILGLSIPVCSVALGVPSPFLSLFFSLFSVCLFSFYISLYLPFPASSSVFGVAINASLQKLLSQSPCISFSPSSSFFCYLFVCLHFCPVSVSLSHAVSISLCLSLSIYACLSVDLPSFFRFVSPGLFLCLFLFTLSVFLCL